MTPKQRRSIKTNPVSSAAALRVLMGASPRIRTATTAVDRILDANLNRAREGLRVAEEVARLVLESASMQSAFKTLRHGITAAERVLTSGPVIHGRAAECDPGAGGRRPKGFRRSSLQDIVQANLRRAQEALRVLEEVSHLKTPSASRRFQRLRFRAYELESQLVRRLTATAGKVGKS